MAKTAREVMSGGVECIGENETVLDAAKKLADLDVGSMPICGEDNRLKGMLTDRDIVVKVLAAGKDPLRMGVERPQHRRRPATERVAGPLEVVVVDVGDAQPLGEPLPERALARAVGAGDRDPARRQRHEALSDGPDAYVADA